MMARRTFRIMVLAAAGLLALAWSGMAMVPVAAQQQAGGDGRALDASPQVGTGGVNAPSGRIDFRLRNDLITGNVGSGRAFRDTVGYIAPGEFGDTLGSDDLFRFRADTLPSGLDRLNAVEAARDYAVGTGTSIYRLHSQPPLAPDRLAPTRLDDVSIGGYWEPRRTDEVDRLEAERWLADPSRLELDTRGRTLEEPFAVSPLLGVRGADARLWTQTLDEDADEAAIDAAVDPDVETDPLTDPLAQPEARLESRLPGLVLGHYLLAPTPADADPTDAARWDEFEQWSERWIEQRWTERVGDTFTPGTDPYSDLLATMRADDRLVDPVEPDDADDPADATAPIELEEPTQRDIERAEQRRQATYERFGIDPDAPRETADALEALLDRLDHRLPRLESLAGERDDGVTQMMREAEQRLTAGDYLDAERHYRRVLAHQRNEPLARVGLVHAQLGAGMYRSAGMHLRHLFEQHPELVAARYGTELLPDAERLQSARDQLERMIEREDRNAGPSALLLAYIGHQAEIEALVRLGLAHAEALHPNDPLVPMLERIWLGDAPDDEAEADGDSP